MPVNFVASLAGGSTATAYVQPYPTGTAAGDVLLAMVSAYFPTEGIASIPLPSGWTQVGARTGVSGRGYSLWARVSGGESSVTMSRPGGSVNEESLNIVMLAYRGTALPVGAGYLAAQQGSQTAHTAPALTAAKAGLLVRMTVSGDSGFPRQYDSNFAGGTERVLYGGSPQFGPTWVHAAAAKEYPATAGQVFAESAATFNVTENYVAAAVLLAEANLTPYVPAIML